MKRVGERQRWVWLASGLSAPVAAWAAGLSWPWVLGGGLLAVLYYIYMETRLRPCGLGLLLPAVFGQLGKWLAGLTMVWTVLVLAWAANLADRTFPMVDGFPILGWVLLGITAWGCGKGPAPCARCAGVVFLFLTAVYGTFGGFALADVEPVYLKPAGSWRDGVWTFGLFLLPAGVWYVPSRRRRGTSWGLALSLPVAAAFLALVTVGVLSRPLADSLPAPLYTAAQSVRVFGALERLEPMLSAAMTMGVFCLLSGLACGCQALGAGLGLGKWTGPVACVLAMMLMGPAKMLTPGMLTAGACIFWLAVPLLAVKLSDRP